MTRVRRHARARRLRAAWPEMFLCAALAALVTSCDTPTTAPEFTVVCGASTIVTLGIAESARVSCASGTTVRLTGSGASYLIAAQFATASAQNASVTFALSASPATPTALSATAQLAVAAPEQPAANTLPGAFHDALRREDAKLAESFRGQTPAAAPAELPRFSFAAVPPTINSVRGFRVLSSLDAATSFTSVGARLEYVGSNILMYIDTLTPRTGFSSADVASLGQLFDRTLYPIDIAAFGAAADVDQNERLIMLMTPVVNQLTPRASCASDGFIAGFFYGFDMTSNSSDSNHGELFYALAPDPAGTFSCSHSVSAVQGIVPSTFVHEFQHLICYSQHVVIRHGAAEAGWLDEGMSVLAEELGSLYYEDRFPPPAGRRSATQFFPDSSQGFVTGFLNNSYAYLLNPSTETITLHSAAHLGLTWRGGVWLLLRWLGDQFGEGIYKKMQQTTLTGTANIAAATGQTFTSVFGDFGLSLYTDSLPGFARTIVPPDHRFTTRNLRRLYQALYASSGPTSRVPRPFPIALATLSVGGTSNSSMLPGTTVYYRLDTPTTTPVVQIQFSRPGGSGFSTSLGAQMIVFRLPN